MSISDLQRLRRAVKVLAKLAWKYQSEKVAEALMKHCSHRERENVVFVGEYLGDVAQVYDKAHSKSEPHCHKCGDFVEQNGPACRRALLLAEMPPSRIPQAQACYGCGSDEASEA